MQNLQLEPISTAINSTASWQTCTNFCAVCALIPCSKSVTAMTEWLDGRQAAFFLFVHGQSSSVLQFCLFTWEIDWWNYWSSVSSNPNHVPLTEVKYVPICVPVTFKVTKVDNLPITQHCGALCNHCFNKKNNASCMYYFATCQSTIQNIVCCTTTPLWRICLRQK